MPPCFPSFCSPPFGKQASIPAAMPPARSLTRRRRSSLAMGMSSTLIALREDQQLTKTYQACSKSSQGTTGLPTPSHHGHLPSPRTLRLVRTSRPTRT